MDLAPRRLRSFLAVAEERHFSRAAATLHLSQPALSQQIRALEDDLGVRLFDRTSQRVAPTAAGEALAQAAPRVLYEMDRAVEETRGAATGRSGLLRIASVRTGLSTVLPRLMRAHTSAHPLVRFQVVHMDTTLQLRALLERTIDVGVVRSAAPVEGLVIEPLVSEPLMVALPHDHPLATSGDEPLDPALLATEPFVMWPRHLGADFFDIAVAFCRDHGFAPTVISEADDIDSQLALVAAGYGVSLQPAFYARSSPDGVVFRALGGPPPSVVLQLASRRHGSTAVAEAFIETARGLDLGR